jgi:sugar phosphate permease
MPFVAVFFLLHEMGRGCWNPLLENYLQSSIPSKERATIASFCSVAPHIGGAIGLLVSGLIAKNYGISVSWFIMGFVFIIGALLVSKNGIKENT